MNITELLADIESDMSELNQPNQILDTKPQQVELTQVEETVQTHYRTIQDLLSRPMANHKG